MGNALIGPRGSQSFDPIKNWDRGSNSLEIVCPDIDQHFHTLPSLNPTVFYSFAFPFLSSFIILGPILVLCQEGMTQVRF